MSENSQRPIHQGRELRLLPCARLGKDLLKLAPRGGQRHSHCIGGRLQTIPLRNGYRHMRFTIGQVKRSSQGIDSRFVDPVRVDDEDDTPRKFHGRIARANRLQRKSEE